MSALLGNQQKVGVTTALVLLHKVLVGCNQQRALLGPVHHEDRRFFRIRDGGDDVIVDDKAASLVEQDLVELLRDRTVKQFFVRAC